MSSTLLYLVKQNLIIENLTKETLTKEILSKETKKKKEQPFEEFAWGLNENYDF